MPSIMPPFRMSPSRIARYFFHDCERFLRFSATPDPNRKAEGVPQHQPDTSPVMDAIQKAGYGWEEQVVEQLLKGKVLIASGTPDTPVRDRRFDRHQTLDALRTAKTGSFIYQGSLRAPDSFYTRFGINSALIRFSDNHPDLIAIETVGQQRRFRVIDIKRGDTAKAIHRIQILLYAWQLEAIIAAEGIDGVVDVATGSVWLGNTDTPLNVDLNPVRPHVIRLLRQDLSRICSNPADQAAWHLHFRCEWCDYFNHCRAETRTTNNISRLAGLTGFGKRFLGKQGVTTVDDLDHWLAQPTADDTLARCASLAGRGHLLRGQTTAFVQDQPIIHGAGSMLLPIGENVAVFLTAQEEPLEETCYLAGVLVSVRENLREPVTGKTDLPKPAVWVAKSRSEVPTIVSGVVTYLNTLFKNVANYNQNRTWQNQLTLQCYVHNERERAVFSRLLMTALTDPAIQQAAMRLLLHFSSPDLVNIEQHPEEPVAYPLVVLLSAQAQLIALPVDTSYTLPESLAALGSSFTYARNPHVHFPLGHAMRPDGIHKVWDGQQDFSIVRNNGRDLLYASRALLFALRQQAGAQLVAWPPKFTMPGTSGIQSPLLAQLAFFSRFESMMSCLEIQATRAEAREIQRAQDKIIELEAVGGDHFKIVKGPATLDENTMPNWLLVADDDYGRLAQLRFPDYYCRDKSYYGKKSPHRAIVGIEKVGTDSAGIPQTLQVAWSQEFSTGFAEAGQRYVMHPRFIDYNTDRVIRWLVSLDRSGPQLLVTSLQAPSSSPCSLNTPVEKRVAASIPSLSLTPSQNKAFQALRHYESTVVWGPPGTGKTHFIGAAIAALVAAHHVEQKPFRILVTAFTHAAIENVLKSVARTLQTCFTTTNVSVWKAGEWRGDKKPESVTEVDPKFRNQILGQDQVVIGATVYACIKASPGQVFNLVVIDEASQVRLSEACIPLTLRHQEGHLLLAGDHQQLPPIVKGEWPDPVKGPAIHGSILTALRVDQHAALGLQLHENWRMNATLTSIAAEFIYGDQYRCATDEIATQQLRWAVADGMSRFAKHCLDPQYPFVMVVLDGVDAGKENLLEARLVAGLTRALRNGMVTVAGTPYANDRDFFHGTGKDGPGVFIVSPHHVQIAAIRKAIARKGLTNPFVDTVEKMQGQEAEAVLISYGVSDPEFALREAAFIYGRNRLNVAITRARCKAVLFLPRPLLDAPPGVLDVEEAVAGLAFMRQLYDLAAEKGDRKIFNCKKSKISVEVLRFKA
ncbi:MAG: AAA family ATPase [Candidatus Competibacteraceae bacterium]|nr:MAG: AAA family ATPase [Candidatus Competibacteraceae bacterium]